MLSGIFLPVFTVLFFVSFSPLVFGENETPFGEWDFNLLDPEIYQNKNNLKKLIIEPSIFFEGDKELGSAEVLVLVTDA